MLQGVTMSIPYELDWLPSEGVHLTHEDLVDLLIALRALIDGTEVLEPNRSHAMTIILVLASAIDPTGDQR